MVIPNNSYCRDVGDSVISERVGNKVLQLMNGYFLTTYFVIRGECSLVSTGHEPNSANIFPAAVTPSQAIEPIKSRAHSKFIFKKQIFCLVGGKVPKLYQW